MQFTIDTTKAKSLILMTAPANALESVVHAMDAYRKACDLANNGDDTKALQNLIYAQGKVELAQHFVAKYPKNKANKQAYATEAQEILVLVERLRENMKAIAV